MRTISFSIAALLLLAACGPEKEDYTKQKPTDEPTSGGGGERSAPPPKPKKKPPPADLGKCDLEITGGMTASQSTPGGKEATNISYWFLPEERKNMMGVDGYVVNCKGDKVRFSLLPGGGKLDGMPFAPKKFTFTKGKSDGASVMVAFTGTNATLADPTGTVDVTELDLQHIKGTIELAGKIVPGNKQVKITGSFNLICPGYSACDFGNAE